ncbi:nitrilase-related carbon-nitrogen hydrolase [Prosthecobacter sp. SYSU 5D2]|uniref:nitrilase-related carbon-nitrogen hydrolase n=1 Tax=Prosthecobacter sp. SYSU 5D2 TaxID=3134134 RepID=UPI0031FEDFE6
MHIHAVQLDPVWENKQASFAKVHALLAGAPPLPGSLIVLPEMFATGFSHQLAVTREPEGGETESFLKAVAAQWQCAVLGGVVTPGPEGKGYNQAVAVAPDSRILARYTKVHPFSYGPEAEVHAPGIGPVVFEWAGIKMVPLICYDLRFPELAREALKQGAELFIYIAAWPARRTGHWLALLQARAIENQAYVLGVNRCGQEPETGYSGRSSVIDPQGVIIADASDGEKVLTAELRPETVRSWRREFPAVKDFIAKAQV